MAFSSTLSFSTAERAAAPTMGSGFENMLRGVKVHEEVITALRVAEIIARGLFVSRQDRTKT